MEYDAVAISTHDLSAGADFFQQSKAASFPFIAANVFDQQANLVFTPHIIKNIGTLTLGIIGLTGGVASSNQDFIIGDWRKALRDQIALLEKKCAMLVVLSSLSDNENNELQKDFSGIDIIVTADKQGNNIQPQRLQNTLRIQSGNRGKYIGRLDVTGHGAGQWSIAAANSAAQAGNNEQPGKTYRSFFLVVHPVTSNDTVGLIEQDIKRNIKASRKVPPGSMQPGGPAALSNHPKE